MRRFITIYLTLLALTLSMPTFAKHPPRLFNSPVKLDDAGRPLYNQWERQEYERRLRERQRRVRRPLAPNSGPATLTPPAKIPGGKNVGEIPNAGNAPAPTDDPTIDPSKFTPSPTQPDPVAEQPPANPTPSHTQDYSF